MLLKRLLIGLLSLVSCIAIADDTELFIADLNAQHGIRPQVLIIFDTSGSMRSSEEVIKEAYEPTRDYGAGSNANKIYWSKVGGDTPSIYSDQYFLTSKNNCQASVSLLDSAGLYNGNLRRWVPNTWRNWRSRWKTLYKNNGSLFECKEDVLNADSSNPATPTNLGFPQDGSSGPYISAVHNVFSGDDAVTLFSANYIYWYNTVGTVSKSRLLIAKEAIESIIKSTSSVDFGLAVFNRDYGDGVNDKNGGRIINKVQTRNSTESQLLIDQLLGLNADGWTPLCESMYEAYRYYAGKGLYYGNDDDDSRPVRDGTADDGSVYFSPFVACQERAYIILMTDGEPTNDRAANSLIATLTGNGAISNSYMPTLSQWMNNYDIDGNADNGDQHITTYTIGFGQSAVDSAGILLTETAERGGGEYYPAASAAALQKAFQATILDILNSSSSLSSPAIANNNFDRTRSLDSVYYSMFMPSNKSVWQGNIKKLTMNSAGVLVDRLGVAAINSDGNIKDDASTFWGGVQDGNAVSEGGVASAMADFSSRKILSNLSENILLEPTIANLKTFYGVATDTLLASELAVAETELSDSLNWLQGLDVDDQNGDLKVNDYRSDIFADPLHSKPLAITYIENGKQVVRLLVGTNAGFLHLFTDNSESDTVTENWAFIPAQLLSYGLALKDVPESSVHQYGMDLSPVAIKIYQSGSVQKIIAIIGMRRGGNSYFALDITNPDSPVFLWKIDSSTPGFSELAQTWSMPTIGSFAYQSGGTAIVTPGLVFGGGYDTNKDSCVPSDSETCNDTTGRAVYIVNALTGAKIWSVEGTSCAADAANVHCIRDSIASHVGVLDSDDDGYIDRLYSGDTGGNVWRMDLNGTDTSKWSVIKLASLGGDSTTTDRRFFTAPVIARTFENRVVKADEDQFSYNKVPYDAILIGSGDRAHPASSTAVEDAFYLLHDYAVVPTLYGEEGYPEKPTPLGVGSLFDITSDPVGNYSGDQVLDVFANMSEFSGWQYRFTLLGEKSLGQGALLDGTVYFTSFVPNSTVNIGCGVSDLGLGWLYAVDLHSGSARFVDNKGDPVVKKEIGSRVPDSLVIHAGIDEQGNSVIRLLGVGQGDKITEINAETNEEEVVYTGTVDTQTTMMPRRIYSYFEEK